MSASRTGLFASLACLWEVTARKPGNVHRFHDFGDTHYIDFAASAAAVAPVLAASANASVGEMVLDGVVATRMVTQANTNLGILLLLAPLAKTSAEVPVETVLRGLTSDDAVKVYEAIRLVNPGGLGRVDEGDVAGAPDRGLRELMALAAGRDLIARQYANGFQEVYRDGVPAVREGIKRTGCLEGGILYAHLVLMSLHPDSLIARKCGLPEAQEASGRAAAVLAAGWPRSRAAQESFRHLDNWLRQRGNARNPGTTADLLAACLFAMLHSGEIALPLTIPWTAGELLQGR